MSVTFTKDLSASNRKAGEWLLGYYWRDSKISKAPYYPVTNFAGLKSYLDSRYPTYIEYLGSLTKNTTSDKLIQSMKDAAAKGLTSYPTPSTFGNSLMQTVSVGEVLGTTAKEVGQDIVDISSMFSKIVIFGGLAVIIVLMFNKSGVRIKDLKVK